MSYMFQRLIQPVTMVFFYAVIVVGHASHVTMFLVVDDTRSIDWTLDSRRGSYVVRTMP